MNGLTQQEEAEHWGNWDTQTAGEWKIHDAPRSSEQTLV